MAPNVDLQHPTATDNNNNNKQSTKKRGNLTERNERFRKTIHNCFSHLHTNLNVLVIGGNNAGKSSLINSMNMALRQQWYDCAKYQPGRCHLVDECVLFNDKKTASKVVFWDARGFEDIHEDEHASLIIRYILEGRIKPKCIPCVLLMPKELIKKRYHRVEEPQRRRIDVILYVSDITMKPSERLMNLMQMALNASKQSFIKQLPIISVCTKSDMLQRNTPTDDLTQRLEQYNLERLVQGKRFASKNKVLNDDEFEVPRPKLLTNYVCELEVWTDVSADPATITPSPQLDAQMFSVWRDIVSRTVACGGSNTQTTRRRRTYSDQTSQSSGQQPRQSLWGRIRSSSFSNYTNS